MLIHTHTQTLTQTHRHTHNQWKLYALYTTLSNLRTNKLRTPTHTHTHTHTDKDRPMIKLTHIDAAPHKLAENIHTSVLIHTTQFFKDQGREGPNVL